MRRWGSGALALILATWVGILPSDASADSVEVDVTKTHADGLNRYCFRITNDDADESVADHAEKICSFYIEYTGDWRDNITGPDGWDGNNVKMLPGAAKKDFVHWSASAEDKKVGPGDQLGDFCFVINGSVTIEDVRTDTKTPEDDQERTLSDMAVPNEGGQTTDANDTDWLLDGDGDGIPDVFDKNPETADGDLDGENDSTDNCDDVPNPQADSDEDGLGDECDPDPANPDSDSDGLEDGLEVHVTGTDPLLLDSDEDGVSDGAEFEASSDPLDPSSLPEIVGDGIDNDGFGVIDEDYDPDGDSIDVLVDNCPTVPNPDQLDSDGDGTGDACNWATVPTGDPGWTLLSFLVLGGLALHRRGRGARRPCA